ncbi:hypothetical protein [Nitrosophilus kaiyonis]|uniref:hypothetical protein n=1 Tax=Nitrosophilus kaiyonis TaxID=2930200 RepID=UPI002490853C|nr:hypothetical protein [Nitrosophilus kaiyonis]
MLYDILQDEEFAAILKNHATSLIKYLLEKDQPFAVLTDTKRVKFDPDLPQDIKSNFSEFTLFMIMNYTFESARIENGNLIFEAGFGPNNFGSIVKVPIESILQIIVDETPIFVNLTATVIKQKSENAKNSMEALLSNPENQKLLKKRKKKV